MFRSKIAFITNDKEKRLGAKKEENAKPAGV